MSDINGGLSSKTFMCCYVSPKSYVSDFKSLVSEISKEEITVLRNSIVTKIIIIYIIVIKIKIINTLLI